MVIGCYFFKTERGKATYAKRKETIESVFDKLKRDTPNGVSLLLEAPPRLELGNRGFAVRCLTTWLWRLI